MNEHIFAEIEQRVKPLQDELERTRGELAAARAELDQVKGKADATAAQLTTTRLALEAEIEDLKRDRRAP